MAYTDFIAAIDLGSSHMVGMVGAKEKGGMIWKSSSFGIFWRQRGMKI